MTVTTLARHTDRETSKQAGRLAETSAKLVEDWVLAQFHEVGAAGMTDFELSMRYVRALSDDKWSKRPPIADWSTPRKRRSDLTRKAIVLATNRTRKGVRSQSTVWVLKDYYGRAA